jgi:curved DNA-binding protein CbpA
MRNPRLEDDYRELGLEPGASLEQVRNSYREQALLWHPDRRNDGPERASKAHQMMTRINLAYERLRKVLERKADSKTNREPIGRRSSQAQRTQNEQGTTEHGHSRARRAQEMRTNSLGMRFVSVEGTSVLFSIWETRVQDYRAYAEALGGVDGLWKNPGFAQAATHPVVNVSWEDARRFCAWLTDKERREGKLPMDAHYRLPADAEWSWAVGIGNRERNGTPKEKGKRLKSEYPWGTAWPPPKGAGNYDPSLGTDSFNFTSPVGSFAENAQGLFDLGGNVWEWCEDFLDGTSGQKRSGGETAQPGVRVLRGGSWNFSGPAHLLSSYRNGVAQDARSGAIGFRIVLVLG